MIVVGLDEDQKDEVREAIDVALQGIMSRWDYAISIDDQ
jgi:ABC-type amino acid transport substrate-binding protein